MTKDPVETSPTVTLRENGPVVVKGNVTVIDEAGTHVETQLFLCRCGKSLKKPECDGSHKHNGFTAPGKPVVWK